MVGNVNRLAGLLLLGVALAVVVVALPHHADAGEYWVVGLPDTGAYNTAPGVSTTIAVTNMGSALDTVTLNKVSASGAPAAPASAAAVSAKTTGILQFNDYLTGTQISNVGVYYVATGQPSEVAQSNSVAGAVFAVGGSGSEASHILDRSQLGKDYHIFTHGNDPSFIYPGQTVDAGFFAVIAVKDGTTIKVTPSATTSPSAGCPISPCTKQGEVEAMAAYSTHVFNLARGQALFVDSATVATVPCAQALLSGPACSMGDLTGTTITSNAVIAVFGGAACWGSNDSAGCNVLQEEMHPDSDAGNVYVVCAGAMNDPAQGGPTSQVDVIRILAVSGTATVTFAVPVASAYTAGPNAPPNGGNGNDPNPPFYSLPPPALNQNTFVATVGSALPTMFYLNKDTVITSDNPILVEDDVDWGEVNAPADSQAGAQNSAGYTVENLGAFLTNTATFGIFTFYGYGGTAWGGPSMVGVTAVDRSFNDHWIYGYPGHDNHIIIGTALGSIITDNGVAVTAPTRSIGTSGYGCTMPVDYTTTGSTHHIQTTGPSMVQMLGLGAAHTTWYGSGATPAPPPNGPLAAFKPVIASTCGPRPVQFTDRSTPGTAPIASWFWDFGDGSSSTQQNPVHTYAAPADYAVTETVTDTNGLPGSFMQIVTATEGPRCIMPQQPQDNGFAARPPHDGVDAGIAEGDVDGDGILNGVDNCVQISNPDQSDIDGDKIGDVCDPDMDGDGLANASDNCPSNANRGQSDLDVDGHGDVCDPDMDGDQILNAADNCPKASNVGQEDANLNQVGDACEAQRFIAPGSPAASRPVSDAMGTPTRPTMPAASWLGLVLAGLAAAALLGLLVLVLARRSRQ